MEGLPRPEYQPVQIPEQHGLKHMSELALLQTILDAGQHWSRRERNMVVAAESIGRTIHQDDIHRGQPYNYHLLRSTARMVKYFHITEAEPVAGLLLHDSVENRPDELLCYSFFGTIKAPLEVEIPQDPLLKQQRAFEHIATQFSPRVARMVEGMTNPPRPQDRMLSYQEKIDQYVEHVALKIRIPDVFFGKLADWGDNGLGITYRDPSVTTARLAHLEYKYGQVTPVLESRFYESDIQAILDPVAKANIRHMFTRARERLRVPG